MDFPELPAGYRWRVIPLIPTWEARDPQVRIEIQHAAWWRRMLLMFDGVTYSDYVRNPRTHTVKAAAEKLYDQFMGQRGNAGDAQEWESALNNWAMK